jgi:hypothetical protein
MSASVVLGLNDEDDAFSRPSSLLLSLLPKHFENVCHFPRPLHDRSVGKPVEGSVRNAQRLHNAAALADASIDIASVGIELHMLITS